MENAIKLATKAVGQPCGANQKRIASHPRKWLMAKIIFRWDLDKTYLKTDFDKVSSLLKTFFQAPEKKETFAGARALLLALMSVHESKVTFVSGSPRQTPTVGKLSLDGIQQMNWF